MRHLGRLLGQRFIVEGAGGIRVQPEVELVFPAEFKTRLGQRIIADLRPRVPLGQIRRVGCDLVGNDAGLHIIPIGQAQMLLGCDIAEHGAAEPADHRRTDAAGDVVIARSDIGGQRPQGIEGCLIAALQLLVHVFLDQLHGHMAGAFDHALHVMLPGNLGQLAQSFQLTELGRIIGIGNRARTQAVAQGEGHVVGLHDLADIFEMGIEEVFLMMRQTPFGHDRTTARDNAGDPLGGQRHIAQQHARMDGEVIHALLGLLDQGIAEDFPAQVLGDAINLFQRLIDGYRTDRHRRVADQPLPGLVDILAGGQVHDGIRAPADTPGHLLDFFLDRGAQRRVADITVDLHQEVAADDHRLQLRVVDIGWQNRPTPGNFLTYELRGDFAGNTGTEAVAGMLLSQQTSGPSFLQLHVLADGDELHLRSDDAPARIVHLRHVLPCSGAAWSAHMGKAHMIQRRIGQTGLAKLRTQPGQHLGIATLLDPASAYIRQPGAQIDSYLRVGVGAGGVIHQHRRVVLDALVSLGISQADLTHGHTDVGARTGNVDLARIGQGLGGSTISTGLGDGSIR